MNEMVLNRGSLENGVSRLGSKYKSKRTNKLLINGNLLFVRNFGSESICESHVKPNDVRVFLMRFERGLFDDEPRVFLNSSLIRVETSSFRYAIRDGESSHHNKDFAKCKLYIIHLNSTYSIYMNS